MIGYLGSNAAQDQLIIIDEKKQILLIKKRIAISLTYSQTLFLKALIEGVTHKDDIIKLIWGSESGKKGENNYHQLIFKTRKLLKAHALPDNLLVTIPKQGVRLNKCVLSPVKEFKLNLFFRLRNLLNS